MFLAATVFVDHKYYYYHAQLMGVTSSNGTFQENYAYKYLSAANWMRFFTYRLDNGILSAPLINREV